MDKKLRLEQTAIRMFVEQGFHGTATAKIAKEAGVANGTLFNYFHSKDSLVETLFQEIYSEMNRGIRENVQTSSVKDAFKGRFYYLIKWSLKNALKFKYIYQFQFSPYFNHLKDHSYQEEYIQLIQKGIDYGLIQELPVSLIQQFIDAHTYSVYNYLSHNELSEYRQEKLIENSFDSLWRMLR